MTSKRRVKVSRVYGDLRNTWAFSLICLLSEHACICIMENWLKGTGPSIRIKDDMALGHWTAVACDDGKAAAFEAMLENGCLAVTVLQALTLILLRL